MPSASLRPCPGGCGGLVLKGKCPACSKAVELRRGSRHERGYTNEWGDYSRRFRQRHPFCGDRPASAPETTDSECAANGRVSPVQGRLGVTDHIVPVTGPADPGFFDESNHQALCNRCHDRKRQRESMAAARR